MKTIYTKQDCAGCVILKAQFKQKGEPFTEIQIGRDISREDFIAKFPDVKRVPYVVEDDSV